MSIKSLHIQEFMKLFTGSTHNYGEFIYSDTYNKGKREGKGYTKKNILITQKNYQDHLEGKKGLGIIPITEDNKCLFAVIDVDIYDVNLNIYIEAIERAGLPLVTFLSKSKGLHIYIFLKEKTNAKRVIDLMRKISSILSIDVLVKEKKNEVVEIFPKQTRVKVGEYGNWINLPYYEGDKSTSVVIKNSKKLNLDEALTFIKSRVIKIEEIEKTLEELPYSDAPPCLQRVYFLNNLSENSGRNDFLFSFGVYLKKKDELYFEQGLRDVNNTLTDSLPDNEIERTILKSLRKKDYIYKCKTSPCHNYCDKSICKKREYGIGKNDGHFSTIELGQLTQYNMATPYYEWEVRLQGQANYKFLRFKSETEIIKQDVFLSLSMRVLYELPPKLKQGEWYKIVNQALKEIKIINIDHSDDTSPEAILTTLFFEFITTKLLADKKEQIEKGRVFFDKDTDFYYFKMKDAISFLISNNSLKNYFRPNELRGKLNDIGCLEKKLTIPLGILDKTTGKLKKKQINVRAISKIIVEKYEDKEYDTEEDFDFSKYRDSEDY